MAAIATNMGMMGGTTRSSRARSESIAERNRERFEAQRRARRGPTPEVFFTKHLDNSRLVKADDPERRREMRMFSIAMTVLFAFVMIYVWQHFTSIELGYKIEAQKLQVDHLREKNRDLRLTEAQLTEPARIDRIAKQLGLDTPQPGQVIRNDNVTGVEAPVLAQVQIDDQGVARTN